MVFLRQTTKRIGRDMPLREQISASWCHIQGHLFPWLQAEVGPLTDNHKRLVTVLEMVRVEAVVSMRDGGGARVYCQVGAQLGDHRGADRASSCRHDAAPSRRLGARGPCAERGDVLARFCRVCRWARSRARA